MSAQSLIALGLMSGTSRDGMDAALLRSDGATAEPIGPFLSLPYETALRDRLGAAVQRAAEPDPPGFEDLAAELADCHAELVTRLLAEAGPLHVDLVGFHGHTLHHAPDRGMTWQLGDAPRLAAMTGLPVVHDFRTADVAAGGQGAPLAPLYHRARLAAQHAEQAIAVLNLGGVANVSWIGPGQAERPVIAFDTGPGNALIDDWVMSHGLGRCDSEGRLATAGQVHADRVAALLAHPYFAAPPPKSLDRDAFSAAAVAGLSVEDGAATLSAFTVAAIVEAIAHVPQRPAALFVCGGGRHNPVLMAGLGKSLNLPVQPVEALGWRADAVEAEAFAYLAIRHWLGLPTSLPGISGVPAPIIGGRSVRPPRLRTARSDSR
ncbi:MAG: anhydro-N-acetylmuramic acid kinase [Rhodothalassiaceae bacterium]